MDLWVKTSTFYATESDPQYRSLKSSRISTGLVDIPMFSGRAVIFPVSGIATRRLSYSTSLNNDTSLSSTTHPLYAVRDYGDRNSVSVSYMHFINHLTQKIVVSHLQIKNITKSEYQLMVLTSWHRQQIRIFGNPSQSTSLKSGKLYPSHLKLKRH